ncbi:MAG: hypothetical protein JWR27_2299 [Aeromicrobium sp.]|jgi:hypothetical protein|nr:hypothetical protein [Aeromicrobium sp.]
MRTEHTTASRAAATATTLLVLVHLARIADGTSDPYVAALLLTLLVATAVVSIKLHRDNCVESRLGAMLLALLSGGGVVLAAVAGLPGQDVHPVGMIGVLMLVVSSAVLGLLATDQLQRVADGRARSPYAS